ncbi:MAG TPA: cyclic nucleotide-binding domain-containing protein [Jatrophihabitans sp.]|nr:cyclic nucleotide-binding domain-containing protein [Jatrophihabitans sp.]
MKADELKSYLAAVDLFQGLSKRQLNALVKEGRETVHADGQEVIAEGTGAIGFHLITSGKARVTTGSAVRRTLGVGDYFGEISVLDGKPRSASVVADGELTTFAIRPHVLEALMEGNPNFARQLLVVLCARLREAESRLG